MRLLLLNKAKNPCLKCAATVLVGNVVVVVTALVVHVIAVVVVTAHVVILVFVFGVLCALLFLQFLMLVWCLFNLLPLMHLTSIVIVFAIVAVFDAVFVEHTFTLVVSYINCCKVLSFNIRNFQTNSRWY